MLRRELPDRKKWPADTVGYTAPVQTIDFNCDMGEGIDSDAIIMPFISSVNIACGYHAGDEDTMRRTIGLALKHSVAIGAHPSYPDKEHFGRIDMLDSGLRGTMPGAMRSTLRHEDIPAIIADQLERLQKICSEFGTRIHHLKPHGALYNRAARDGVLAGFICQAIGEFDRSILFYGLSGSEMEKLAGPYDLHFVNEVFADRSYRDDGHLTPRSEANALIREPAAAVRQALQLIRDGKVSTTTGGEILLKTETICIHGDGAHAPAFARSIHEEIRRAGIRIQAP
jgi:5-oxoprolinase (ATP-hydrolysing) subunit A